MLYTNGRFDLIWVGLGWGQRVAETPMMPIMEAPSGHLYVCMYVFLYFSEVCT